MGVVCKAIEGNVDSAVELKLSAAEKESGFNCPPPGRVKYILPTVGKLKWEHGSKRTGLPQ